MRIDFLNRFSGWIKILKDDAVVLYYAWKHPFTPGYIKGLIVAVIAYVFSPVDILPDYLPLIGIADDALLLPTAVVYITKLLPDAIFKECYHESLKWRKRLPWVLGIIILMMLVWLSLSLIGLGYLIFK
ncbi:YkvA family protein [Dendrosporobacter sp. 1207_IL3150]|uniref:YkvA family protein n=1 Tax=Dendrosporobacter sp. 1207_IL3150 TaxID=3084054 RepID=UPI002FDB323D